MKIKAKTKISLYKAKNIKKKYFNLNKIMFYILTFLPFYGIIFADKILEFKLLIFSLINSFL